MNSKRIANLSSLLLLCLVSLFFIAQECDNAPSDAPRGVPLAANMMERAMVVTSVDSMHSEEGQTMVQISLEVPDPCWKYSRYETSLHDGVALVKVYAMRDKDEQCIQKISSIQTTLTFGADVRSLRFWQSDEATLDAPINR